MDKSKMPPFLSPQERKAARGRALKRAQNAYERREHLRDEIEARTLLGKIWKLLAEPWEHNRHIIAINKAKLDGSFRLLEKVLPSLRPVDPVIDLDEDGQTATVVQILSGIAPRVVKTIERDALGTIGGNEPPYVPIDEEEAPWLN